MGDQRTEEFPALTRTMFVRYAGASGDFNPMHHDDTIATQVGNPSVFGHGMLSMGLAARVVKDWFGPEAIRRLQVRFAKQVWPGDVLTCTAVVTGKREEGGEHLVDLELTVANQNGEQAVAGAATAAVGRLTVGLLDGRVAIVTGSGRGIGREFALCFGREGAKVVVNDVGVSLDGRGTDEDPGRAGVQGDRGARRRGGAELRLRQRLRRRGRHRADRGRRVRHGRHPRQQRRHRPRPLAAQDGGGRLRRGDRRPPQGHVQLHTSRGAGDEGQGLRPHRQHHVVGRACAATSARPTTARPRPGSWA